MPNGIHKSLASLAVDIDVLLPLDNNPRRGSVEAIIASYAEFGQIKPIVIRPNDDGTATVIAGNHQLEAAKRLGWDKIAAVPYDVDNKRAIAFAIADNRTMELGYTEPELLNEFVLEIGDYYPDLIEGLGWDEFSFAEIEQKSIREDNQVISTSSDYFAPALVSDPTAIGNGFTSSTFTNDNDENDQEQGGGLRPPLERPGFVDHNAVSITRDKHGNQEINVRPGVDQNDAVIRGSTTVSPGSAPRAIVQYTIVFDNPDQQARWYEFIKWLRSAAHIDGSTTAERLIDFIDQHIEI